MPARFLARECDAHVEFVFLLRVRFCGTFCLCRVLYDNLNLIFMLFSVFDAHDRHDNILCV